MKKYLIPVMVNIGVMLIGTLISSILYYFNLTSDKINGIMLYLISFASIFVGSMMLAKELKYKGLITGLFYFLFWFIISIFISFVIFKCPFDIKNIIYYLVLLAFSLLGSIIGKNIQKENDTI